jgi:CRP-like cAMP-binding protein
MHPFGTDSKLTYHASEEKICNIGDKRIVYVAVAIANAFLRIEIKGVLSLVQIFYSEPRCDLGASTSNHFDLDAFFAGSTADRKLVFFRRKQIIFSEGDRSDAIFFIEHGIVKLTVTSDQGKEAVIGIFDGGHLFGESCLSSDQPVRFHNAIALTDMRVAKIDRQVMVRSLRAGGESCHRLVTYLLRRNMQIQEDLVNNLLYPSEVRLTRVLLSLTKSLERDKTEHFLKLSQQTLAEMIGTTRQRVNVLMKQFKSSRVMDDKGKLTGGRTGRNIA